MAYNSRNIDPSAYLSIILRVRIYSSRYWKQRCFGLDAETILEKAKDLDHIGFGSGGMNRPSPFACLLAKLLQISPSIEIMQAYLDFSGGKPTNSVAEQQRDLRYMRALVATYIRMVGTSRLVFRLLEPLLSDYRKVNILQTDGRYERISMDEFLGSLLNCDSNLLLGIALPVLTRRNIVESRGDIGAYRSPLDDGE